MKKIFNFLAILIAIASVFSCSNFEDLSEDNNTLTFSPSSFSSETWKLCDFSNTYEKKNYLAPVSWGEYLKFDNGTLYWNNRLGGENTTYSYKGTETSYSLYRNGYKENGFTVMSRTDSQLVLKFEDGLYRWYLKDGYSSIGNSSASSYKITFNANGGSLTTATQTVTANVQSSLESATSLNLKRDGYIFKGWARYNTATTIEIEDGGSVTLSSDMTLYAIWAYNATYTISFNANGGTLTTSSQSVTGETINGEVTASVQSAELLGLERSGFIFKGWSKSSSATSASFEDGCAVTVSENTTLYAIWAYNVEYTVSFEANGGSITTLSQPVSGETVDGSLAVSLKKATVIGLSKSGYKFKGWATSSSASTALYTDGSKISISGNITIYAVWDKIVSYTITYNANGGSMSSTSQIVSGTESDGASATLYSASRSGYVLSGWSTSSYGSAQYSSGATITIKANISLYAVWSLPQYTVTYVVDSQSYGQLRAPQVKKIITGTQTISLPSASSLGYSKSGYEFLGWKTSQSSNSYYSVGSSITISRDTTLYAAWKELYINVYLYHPGYKASSGQKFGSMAVSVGGASKSFSISSMRNGSYTSSTVKMSGVSGSNAWATSFTYQKTGYKATTVSQSGYMNFVSGGTYKINVVTGAVTKTN
ncbi:MAG: InlB B-repeat-containing protein [Treponema sp.]|nr:InlB B-repeat-containing protein [Treponema sp.]MBR0099710.1 InlB B-repeat-containing protein [Treponema sp.]